MGNDLQSCSLASLRFRGGGILVGDARARRGGLLQGTAGRGLILDCVIDGRKGDVVRMLL